MPTFNTVEELVQILDSDPRLLEALRSRLLTKELLELPERFDEYAAASDKRFTEYIAVSDKRFAEYIAVSDKRFDDHVAESDKRFAEYIAASDKRYADHVAESDKRFAEFKTYVDNRFDSVERTLKVHTDDIGELKGIGLESRLHNRGVSQVATLLSLRNNHRVRVAEQDANSVEFNDRIYAAEENGVLSESEYNRLLDTDMIVRGRRRGSRNDVYVPIEASYSIARSDIVKVKSSADILGKVFPDAEICPVLYFMNISEHLSGVAEEEKVDLIRVERLLG